MTSRGLSRILFAAWFLGMMISSALAQTDSSATSSAPPGLKPNTLYYVKGDELIKVEETAIDVGAGTSASGVGAIALGFGSGVKTWMILPSVTSELQISEPQPRFRMAVERSLAQRIRLGAFEVKKDKRRARTESANYLEFFKPAVEIELTKVAEGVYEFSPKKPLQPGEYAFSAAGAITAMDFTIVGKKK